MYWLCLLQAAGATQLSFASAILLVEDQSDQSLGRRVSRLWATNPCSLYKRCIRRPAEEGSSTSRKGKVTNSAEGACFRWAKERPTRQPIFCRRYIYIHVHKQDRRARVLYVSYPRAAALVAPKLSQAAAPKGKGRYQPDLTSHPSRPGPNHSRMLSRPVSHAPSTLSPPPHHPRSTCSPLGSMLAPRLAVRMRAPTCPLFSSSVCLDARLDMEVVHSAVRIIQER